MATKTISELPSSAIPLTGTELYEATQVSGGFPTSVKVYGRDINQSPTHYIRFDTTYQEQAPHTEGLLEYDLYNHTVQCHNDIPAMRLQLGQETVVRVFNDTGEVIPNGSAVYVTGSYNGNSVTIAPALASDESTLIGLGVTTHNVSAGTYGYMTKRGLVRDLDTSPFSPGDELWATSVSGGVFVNTRPVSPDRLGFIGFAVSIHPTSGSIYVDPVVFPDQMKIVSYNLPLSGVTDTQIPLVGSLHTVASSATAAITADFGGHGQHVFVRVNTLTGGGDLVVNGDSIDESTGVVTTGDSETLTVYTSASRPAVQRSQYYQTTKKWLAITGITIGGTTGINFNYGHVGYPDMGNRNFRILGYRLEAFSEGPAPDLRFRMWKIDGSHGNKKMDLHVIEDIGIDSDSGGDQIIDHVRTGADDRSYNSPLTNLWNNGEIFTFKQLDFQDYWAANPYEGEVYQINEIYAKNEDSGYIIRLEGEPEGGGITNVQYINLLLYYETL